MRAFIKSSSRQPQHLLASAIGLAVVSLAAPALAEEQGTLQLDKVSVQGEQEAGYKTESVSSPKYTAPLLDTPQTVTVVPAEVIKEQNALSLRQVLSNVSGITFGAGEGGNYGDSINIRGFSATNNLMVDGLRDSANMTRSDMFNLEMVEVVKGPSSVYAGAGATAGAINMVSKTPRLRESNNLQAGVGTDGYHRLAADINQPLEGIEGAAARINLMAHENDVAGRDQINYERWGIAPSVAFGLGTPTRLTLSYLHQSDENLPEYGLPAIAGKVLAGVDRDDYFGFRNIDTEEVDVDSFTAKFEHDFNDWVSLDTIARYSETDNRTVTTRSYVQTVGSGIGPGQYRYRSGSGNGRDTTTKLAINQTNLKWNFATGFIEHSLVTGFEVSRETLDRTNFSNNLDLSIVYDLDNPPGYYVGPRNKSDTSYLDAELTDHALYVFDTLALSDQWDLTLGARWERYEGNNDTHTIATDTDVELESSDEMFSGRVGLAYKPVENGTIYVAWGNSYNPSAQNLATSGSGLNVGNQDLDPEKNETWELGTKWDLLDQRLSLNAAIFRVDKTNGRVELDDGTFELQGEQRVQGFELGASGKITDKWQVFASYTQLSSEVLKAAPGEDQVQEGQALANTPPRSFSVWTSYQLPADFEVGYGAQFVDERNVAVATGDTPPQASRAKIDAYWVHGAMLGYQASKQLQLQLNVNNLFDEEYYDRVRTSNGTGSNSGGLVPGDGRSAVLSANYSF
ncbi:catecholate siderophore receptor [Pseudomonas linyingensis]|uniref:Catecholate siderophore receptor n=1 Tax=Pseudomonas linyingensis TaxID=915471 RepID=A0A1H6YB54_9PSED|nr:TonB-dependent siderophore receptor [Pseudomonas linyingensis]SEJ34432.1 catecholate siderophore receptor [Pseudomonas linyingensis]